MNAAQPAPTPDAHPQTFLDRHGLLVDVSLVLAVLLAGLVWSQAGVFSVDESHYLLASQAMAERGSFQIHNGYLDTGAQELLYFYTVVPDRVAELGTVSTVPPFHAIIAAPFLWLAGAAGLVWLNLLAFGLALVALRRAALALLDSGVWALVAAGVFGLATFSLEYAFGMWPHALSQCLAAWSLVCLLAAAGSPRAGRWLFTAGLLCGLATGVRLVNFMLLPGLVLAAAAGLKVGWRRWIWLLVGAAGPLVAFAAINLVRLDTPNPFTYGRALAGGLGRVFALLGRQPWLALLPPAAIAGAWWAWRRTRRTMVWWGLGLAALAAGLALPQTRAWLARWVQMAGFHYLDTALAADPQTSVGAHFNALGQVLYGGVLKKSLLEAAPWVVLAGLFLLPGRLRPALTARAAAVGLVALIGLALLPAALSPGGFCHNPRYLLELLPALSLGAVYWARPWLASRWAWLVGAPAGLAIAWPTLARPGRVDDPAGGWLPMLLPMGLAAGLGLTAALATASPQRLGRRCSRLAGVLLAAGLVYAGLIHSRVDLPRSLQVRWVAKRMAQEGVAALPAPPGRSVLLAWRARKDVFTPVKLQRDVWIGGLSAGRPPAPSLLEGAPAGRRVFVLADGIPPDLFQRWFGRYGRRLTERSGLSFVELLRPGAPP